MATLTLKNDQRVGAIGRTRCGKTYAMEKLLDEQPRVLTVDNKHRCNFPGYYLTYDAMAAIAAIEKGWKVTYRPNGEIPSWFWTRAMDVLHRKGGGIIYVDEMPEVCSANFMPSGLKTVFRLGGELGVAVWWCSQESTGIHNTALRQSDVLLLFLNHGASDRQKLIATAGDMGEVTAHLHRFEFVVYESGGESYDPTNIPVYMIEQPNTTPATDDTAATGD